MCRYRQRIRLPGIPDGRSRRRAAPIAAAPDIPRPARVAAAAPPHAARPLATQPAAPVAVDPEPAWEDPEAEWADYEVGGPGCERCTRPARVRVRLNHPRGDLPAELRSGQEHDYCETHAGIAVAAWMVAVGRFGSATPLAWYPEL